MHDRDENVYKIFVRKPVGKRPLGRPRCRLDSCGSVMDQWQVIAIIVMNLLVP
jgi:hypothetical protein